MTVAGRVSVVIAVKDGAAFVSDAIASVHGQTYGDVELLVVDDGSTDGTADVVRAAGVDRLVMLPSNRGPAEARNVAFALATGEFVTCLDADDMFAPTKIERQVARLGGQPPCDIVMIAQELRIEPGVEPPQWYVEMPDTAEPPAPIAMLTRMSTVLRAGGLDPSFRVAEDTEWLWRMERLGARTETLNEPLYIRRLHGGNATYDGDALQSGLFRILRGRIREQNDPVPDVEVVIPVRDGRPFLGEAIESVRAQAGPRRAVIVVDDGSTDGSGDLARSMSSEEMPVRVVDQPPLGAGPARNHGVLLSRAPFLAFLDADDVWAPGKLTAQLDALSADSDAGIALGWIDEFGEAERPNAARLRAAQPASAPSVALVRRTTFAAVGGFTSDASVPEWMEWWMRATDAGVRAVTISDVVAHRRVHARNRSHTAGLLEKGAYHALLRESLARRRDST